MLYLTALLAASLAVVAVSSSGAAAAASPALTPQAASDRITKLPGFDGTVPFEQYGGYLNVDEAHNRNLFYWFVESQKDPANDPIVLWLQGGPGCSSLLGMLSENGPFHADPSGSQVSLNPYSWNKLANVLYLEAPAGVGFSFSDDKSDYTTGDQKTADDNYKALQQFFARYPHMNSTSRPLYLTGESYAGHYLPDLAARILLGNRMKMPFINLKGFADGNPLTDLHSNMYEGTWPTYWSHALISPKTHEGFVNDCKTFPEPNKECNHWNQVASADMQFINPYDLYVPVCVSSEKKAIAKALAPYNKHLAAYAELPLGTPGGVADGEYDPCMDKHLTEYLNRKDVKEAIHARTDITWVECANLNYSTTDVERSMVPFYEKFFENDDLHIMIYSGDVDSVCPFLGSMYWIDNFKQKIVDEWKPYYLNKQVAGYVQKYEKITLATVRGAGHMVPQFKPAQAFELFKNYLDGTF